MRCNWIHILSGVRARWTRTLSTSRGGGDSGTTVPLHPRVPSASGVVVFNGSKNRGWLSICGQLGTILWSPLGDGGGREGGELHATPIDSELLSSDKTYLVSLDKWSTTALDDFRLDSPNLKWDFTRNKILNFSGNPFCTPAKNPKNFQVFFGRTFLLHLVILKYSHLVILKKREILKYKWLIPSNRKSIQDLS